MGDIFGVSATLVWIVVFALGIALEFFTVHDKQKNTTASVAFFWRLRAIPVTRALLVAAFAWLVYHFFFEDAAAATTAVDDWAIVAASFLATFVRKDGRLGR
jgi:hypothetical protein